MSKRRGLRWTLPATLAIVFVSQVAADPPASIAGREGAVQVTGLDELLDAGFEADAKGVYRDSAGRYFRLFIEGEAPDPTTLATHHEGSDSRWFGPLDFLPLERDRSYSAGRVLLQCAPGNGSLLFSTPVPLPTGSTIVGLEFFGLDRSADNDAYTNVALYETCQPAFNAAPTANPLTAFIGTAANNPFSQEKPFYASDLSIDATVDNSVCHYSLTLDIGCADADVRVFRVLVRWRNMTIH